MCRSVVAWQKSLPERKELGAPAIWGDLDVENMGDRADFRLGSPLPGGSRWATSRREQLVLRHQDPPEGKR